MALSFQTKGSLKGLENKLKAIDSGFNTGDYLEKTAQELNSSIQVRVQKGGKGVKGLKMKPYSGSYGTFKNSTGRQTAYRDLTFSGKMWQSLTTSKTKNEARMFFGNAESVNKASGNHARTPFFGLSPKEKALLNRRLKKLVEGVQG